MAKGKHRCHFHSMMYRANTRKYLTWTLFNWISISTMTSIYTNVIFIFCTCSHGSALIAHKRNSTSITIIVFFCTWFLIQQCRTVDILFISDKYHSTYTCTGKPYISLSIFQWYSCSLTLRLSFTFFVIVYFACIYLIFATVSKRANKKAQLFCAWLLHSHSSFSVWIAYMFMYIW